MLAWSQGCEVCVWERVFAALGLFFRVLQSLVFLLWKDERPPLSSSGCQVPMRETAQW